MTFWPLGSLESCLEGAELTGPDRVRNSVVVDHSMLILTVTLWVALVSSLPHLRVKRMSLITSNGEKYS